MVWGMKIWDGSSNLRLDTTDYITRLIWSKEVNAGDSGSEVVSAISGLTTLEIVIITDRVPEYDSNYPHESDPINHILLPHLFYRSGTTLYWTAQGDYPYTTYDAINTDDRYFSWNSADCLLCCFAID